MISIRRRGGPGPQPGRGAAGIEIAPASEIHHVGAPNGSDSSTFSKISSFRNFDVMEPVAWSPITFFATASAHIHRGPSHDPCRLIDSEEFQKDAFSKEQNAREDPKRPIDPEQFVRANCPLPVLLFGVTTLRVT